MRVINQPFQLLRLFLFGCLTTSSLQAAQQAQIAPQEELQIQESYRNAAREPGSLLFVPPEGWRLADPKALPPNVQFMVVGKGRHEMPPSINLGTEAFNGSIKDYLKIVKSINDAQRTDWKDLGTIRTEAGEASLSQVDMPSEWGELRLMHVILVHDGQAYIVTAAALKDEFPHFYKDFFKAFRSLRFAPKQPSQDGVALPAVRKAALEQAKNNLRRQWKALVQKEQQSNPNLSSKQIAQELFSSNSFQQQWKSFETTIQQKFAEMDEAWKQGVIEQMKQELFQEKA